MIAKEVGPSYIARQHRYKLESHTFGFTFRIYTAVIQSHYRLPRCYVPVFYVDRDVTFALPRDGLDFGELLFASYCFDGLIEDRHCVLGVGMANGGYKECNYQYYH